MTDLKLPVTNKEKTPASATTTRVRVSTQAVANIYRNIMYDMAFSYTYYLLLASLGLFLFLVLCCWPAQPESTLGSSQQVVINIFKTVFGADSDSPDVSFENSDYVPYPLSDAFIDHVNERATTWEAGRNFHSSTSMQTIKKMMGVLPKKHVLGSVHSEIPMKLSSGNKSRIDVENFDAREKWPMCSSLREIRDQGGCGSCWAFGAAETMTDRHCILHGTQFRYSAEELVSCCSYCGDGCDGGYPDQAFNYWKKNGIVSGGAYESHKGCQPYEVPACEHHVEGPRPECDDVKTPKCEHTCIPEYNSTYEADKHFATDVYGLSSEEEILNELFENGPVEATFMVYEDFLQYKSGVYQHVFGSPVGGHAVKVIGFGVENDVPYYLCANSWNYDWGMGGFFKMARDEMHRYMFTGLPGPRG